MQRPGHSYSRQNEIGDYSGTRLFDDSLGEHSVAFEITADGAWTAIVKHPTKARSWTGSGPLTGNGDDVVRVAPSTSGLTVVTASHSGDSNFSISSFAETGRDLVVNEIGQYSGQVTLDAGTYLLEITASGTWSITPG